MKVLYNTYVEHIKALYHYLLALVALILYGYPAKKLNVIAVTGTSGKTTTAHIIYHILTNSGHKAGLISSVTAIIGNKSYDTGFHVTTPTHLALQKFLWMAGKSGIKDLVVEASSHGIAQHRLVGCNINIAVVTNISHEHLDWHKTFDSYAKTKLSLLKMSNIGLIHKDKATISLYRKFNLQPRNSLFTYSLKDPASDFNADTCPYQIPLPGEYNRENALAALAVSSILGVPKAKIQKSLKSFRGVLGRYDRIPNDRGLEIIVDFAHKPNALEAFLKSLETRKGRLIVMFGSAGERDVQKRPLMGKIAAKYADIIVLTDEDPRSEKSQDIIDQIAQGCLMGGALPGPGKEDYPWFTNINNRAAAINNIINNLSRKHDTVCFLGKSHEKSMCYGKKELPWNEYEEINKALAKK